MSVHIRGLTLASVGVIGKGPAGPLGSGNYPKINVRGLGAYDACRGLRIPVNYDPQ